jgi:hypothetical protein
VLWEFLISILRVFEQFEAKYLYNSRVLKKETCLFIGESVVFVMWHFICVNPETAQWRQKRLDGLSFSNSLCTVRAAWTYKQL